MMLQTEDTLWDTKIKKINPDDGKQPKTFGFYLYIEYKKIKLNQKPPLREIAQSC